MLCDGNTYNYGYIGSRATGPEAGDYLVAGPDWKGDVPSGIKKVFRSSTQFSLVAYRTQLFNPDDMPNVVKIQSGYKAQPLSQYLGQTPPAAAPVVSFPKINAEMVKTGFFDYLGFALQFAPAGPEEKEIRAKLARLGIGAGKKFDFKDLSPEQQAQVGLGMKDGEAKIEQYLQSGQKNINGWKVGSLFGHAAFFNGDWLKRAAAAKGGIYGNDAVEANEEKRRRVVDALHPEGQPRRGQGEQLAPRPERPHLPRHAPLLAEGDATLHPSGRRRHLETSGNPACERLDCWRPPSQGGGPGRNRSVLN
jgi:hypothetical protein